MKISTIADKLRLEKKEFVTSDELTEYCKVFDIDHKSAIHYLIKMKYLVRIFRGIFYVKTLEEFKLGITSKYNPLELVTKGLELKGVKNWYFGLHTALKLNNITHEHFAIDEVVSDTVFRAKPINIAGSKFRFVKLSPALFNFGINKENMYLYSDPEKTILDFIYLLTYNGMSAERIVMDMADWAENISENKIRKYSDNYPKTVAKIASEVIAAKCSV